MSKNAVNYFENIIIPLIQTNNTPDWQNFIKEKEKNAVDSGY